MSEALAALTRANLAAAGAVALVLLLRPLIRRAFGAQTTYALWLLVPAAALAMLAPPRVVTVTRPAAPAEFAAASASAPGESSPQATLRSERAPLPWVPILWGAGLALSAGWLAAGQLRFTRALRAGQAGPAVVGFLRPRIVTPDDFKSRYTPREQQLILAHEHRHIRAQDPRINAMVAAARCLAWFNPLVHVLSHFLRIDQELACDAAVIAAHPGSRRTYAEAMLKTQLALRPLPLGCYWPAAAARPLELRIGLLARPQPDRRQLLAGALLVAALAGALGAGAWRARPATLQFIVHAPAAPEPLRIEPARPAPSTPPPAMPAVALLPPPPPVLEAPELQALAPPQPPPVIQLAPPERSFRVWTVARPSRVEPGQAVRVIARMSDGEGRRLVTDLTAFGSQNAFRTGYYERDGSRRSLFTSVEQHGDELLVTASLGKRFAPETTGTIALRSGQTGALQLPSGESVTVTAVARAETAEEAAAAVRPDLWDRENRLAQDRLRALEERRRVAEERRRLAEERRRLAMLVRPLDLSRCGTFDAIC